MTFKISPLPAISKEQLRRCVQGNLQEQLRVRQVENSRVVFDKTNFTLRPMWFLIGTFLFRRVSNTTGERNSFLKKG